MKQRHVYVKNNIHVMSIMTGSHVRHDWHLRPERHDRNRRHILINGNYVYHHIIVHYVYILYSVYNVYMYTMYTRCTLCIHCTMYTIYVMIAIS